MRLEKRFFKNFTKLFFSKPLIKSFIVMGFILVFLEMSVTIVAKYNYSHQEWDWNWLDTGRLPYKIEECQEIFQKSENQNKTKIVIFGDSIPEMGFYPKFFDNLTGNNTISYNLAFGGTESPFQKIFLDEIIIKKIKPNIIIWAIDRPDFYTQNVESEEYLIRHKSNYKYYSAYNLGSEILNTGQKVDDLLGNYLMSYRYRNNLIPQFLDQNSFENEDFSKILDAGFFPTNLSEFETNLTNFEEKYDYNAFSSKMGQIFLDSINTIKNNNISYLIINAPTAFSIWHYSPFDDLLNMVESEHFLNMSGDTEFLNSTLWKNAQHTNKYGAEIYTKKIQIKLSELIEN